MKTILLLSIAILAAFFAFGQSLSESQPLSYNIHSRGDASISLSGNRLMNDPFGSQFAGGVKIRMFLGKRVSFDSDLVFGKDYVHFGPELLDYHFGFWELN